MDNSKQFSGILSDLVKTTVIAESVLISLMSVTLYNNYTKGKWICANKLVSTVVEVFC